MSNKIIFIEINDTLLFKKKINNKNTVFFRYKFCLSGLRKIINFGFDLVFLANTKSLSLSQCLFCFKIIENEGITYKLFDLNEKATKHQGLRSFLGMTHIDSENSVVIGKSAALKKLSSELSLSCLHFSAPTTSRNNFDLSSWDHLFKFLHSKKRITRTERITKETQIILSLNLDGDGSYLINTGLKFLDHMLNTLCHHSQMDMQLQVKGDLEVDEHHSVEDIAIVIGDALQKALGDKRGLARYGYLLPMDEALATCALDFSGRPELIFEAKFARERVGDLPTELVRHFFYSFAIHAACNLYLKIDGVNEHHMIEAGFKALGKCIKQAVTREGTAVPSTKGTL